MAHHTHVHLHLSAGMFGGQSTADAFEEAKHKREGGKFSSTGGSGGGPTNRPAIGAAAFAAKHKHDPAAARKGQGPNAEEELNKARENNPIL